MKSVLVVCEGNICRSPMAEGLLRAMLPVHVESAGLGALVGMPADPIAVALMQERRIDISRHRARQLTRKMCLDCELVLVMEVAQRARIEEMYPHAKGRVFCIGEHGQREIPDPFRRSVMDFRRSLELIERGVEMWSIRINQLLSSDS